MKAAIYAGSFDPITNGHIDIIQRGTKVFDKICVVIMKNSNKKYTFTESERLSLLKESVKDIENIEVEVYDGLLANYCRQKKVYTLIRGLRMLTDFDYEFQMATINRKIDENIESVLFVANNKYSYVSSSAVKELASYNVDISQIVPKVVEDALKNKFKEKDN